MKPISLKEIVAATNGKLHLCGAASSACNAVTCVCTDSRAITFGSLFIALRGDNFDGHDFLPQARTAGAVAALVDHIPASVPAGLHLIEVTDTRKAMGKLANFVRRQFAGRVIGVVGSNGKTSTKNLIHFALSNPLCGSASQKSFNNDVGVPVTIFAANPADDYLVLEMGTNHPGEIAVLAEISQPDIVVITNCGEEHLEGLISLDGVRAENAAVIRQLAPQGALIINGDDPKLLAACAAYHGKWITFGLGEKNDVRATDISTDFTGTEFHVVSSSQSAIGNRQLAIRLPLIGAHMACNALAAIAVARYLGLNDQRIIDNLADATGADMRLQLQELGGVTVLNDAYNANPASMRAALHTLAGLPSPKRRIAVLGDMRELGDTTARYHTEIGELAAKLGMDHLYCVGSAACLIGSAAKSAGMPAARITTFADAAGAAAVIPAQLDDGDLLLLKGSRAMRLEKIAHAIAQRSVVPAVAVG